MKKFLIILCSLFLLIFVFLGLDYTNAFPNLEKKYLAFRYGILLNSVREKNNLPPVKMNMLYIEDDGVFLSQIAFGDNAEIYFIGSENLRKYNEWMYSQTKTHISYWGNLQLLKDSLFDDNTWNFLVKNCQIDSFLLKENIKPSLMFGGITMSFKWHKLLFKVEKQFEKIHFFYPLADTLAIGSNLYAICNTLEWKYQFKNKNIIISEIALRTPIQTLPYGKFYWYDSGMNKYILIDEKHKDSLLQTWDVYHFGTFNTTD